MIIIRFSPKKVYFMAWFSCEYKRSVASYCLNESDILTVYLV